MLLLNFAIYGSEIPRMDRIWKSKNVTFFLSTTRSGSNLVTASLSAISRKPIWWLWWTDSIFDHSSECRKHPSYNRLGLPLISSIPLLYRTHYEFSLLMRVPSKLNKLIFVTRNPKELLFREFFLKSTSTVEPDSQFIETFLKRYLQAFKVYDSWFVENRRLVFYEDFINQGDEILVQLLQFMDEEPKYLDDFITNKQEYMSIMLESYARQHKRNSGGLSSSTDGPKSIYYTKNASLEILTYIDEYIEKEAPKIWELYLKRFQVVVKP